MEISELNLVGTFIMYTSFWNYLFAKKEEENKFLKRLIIGAILAETGVIIRRLLSKMIQQR